MAWCVTVHVRERPKPNIVVKHVEAKPETVYVGEAVTFEVRFKNEGNARGRAWYRITVNGSEVHRDHVVLRAGEERTVAIAIEPFNRPGDYKICAEITKQERA